METAEYVSDFLTRIIRRAGRRVALDGPAELPGLIAARQVLDEAIVTAVRGMREEHGYSWADIARELGTSRQAAQQTFGRRPAA